MNLQTKFLFILNVCLVALVMRLKRLKGCTFLVYYDGISLKYKKRFLRYFVCTLNIHNMAMQEIFQRPTRE